MQYLGRLMRDVDPVPIRAALERWETVPREEKARFAALEGWRDRILADAAALDAFVAEHPDADRASLARLADAARNERSRGEPPRAFRELFRAMRRATGNG
jgi:ribosome-associated protein